MIKTGMKTFTAAVLVCSLLLTTVTAAATVTQEPGATDAVMILKLTVDGTQHTFQVTLPDTGQPAFTQEQVELLRAADTITGYFSSGSEHPSGEEGSYWAIEFIYGCMCLRLHFSPIDATNLHTVTALVIVWLATVAAIIGIISVGTLLKPALILCGYIVSVISIDYLAMYGLDANEDKSFDFWVEITWYNALYALGGSLWGRTPDYKWLITPAGAYPFEPYKPVFHRSKPRLIGGHVGMDVHPK